MSTMATSMPPTPLRHGTTISLTLLVLLLMPISGIEAFSIPPPRATPTFQVPPAASVSNVPFLPSSWRRHRHGNAFSAMIPSLTAISSSSSSSGQSEEIYVPADDGEALQALFSKHCGAEGLMTLEELKGVPSIRDMLEQGDLLPKELSQIWNSAPKFPSEEADATLEKIDVDSFIQVFRDIDDLFEEDDEDEEGDVVAAKAPPSDSTVADTDDDVDELKETFAKLTINNNDKMLTFNQLRQWEEIKSLIEEEGMLGDDEFETLWKGAATVKDGSDDTATTEWSMDLTGFLKFNDALDDLFVFDEEDDDDDGIVDEDSDDDVADEEDETEDETEMPIAASLPVITEYDLPPGVLFSQIANENYLVGTTELQRWGELNDMISTGDLTEAELATLFGNVAKAPGTKDMLDEDGFLELYDAIDALFEDVDDDGDGGDDSSDSPGKQEESNVSEFELKEELLELLEDIAAISEEEGRQPCGLDCTELEQERVLEVVAELEREPYNQVRAIGEMGSNTIDKQELVGLWDLIYSSSSTMKYNEGLSGLAGGLTKFGGLQQRLSATKYLSDVEYIEQVIGKLGEQSYEVKITGDWDLRTEISLFTGKPSNVLSVTPDKVSYGPRSDKADHWKSLGPMNLLVLAYLDDDLRIMRGSTSTDTLFIFRRSN
mmetsp:Transcript_32377/g.65056  ORF Transcript_32377/g.65056 Transcript_32377/m.65056 type:complete len:661 (+) Transcript_32377:56-2038(+)